jgi:hypothetical protein
MPAAARSGRRCFKSWTLLADGVDESRLVELVVREPAQQLFERDPRLETEPLE